MRKYLLLFFLLLTLPAAPVRAQQADAERLFARFKAAAGFDHAYPREKVYLHLDNSAYLEGDSLWYKAYVVRASSLAPTSLSRVLYVELLNADGQLMEKQTLRLDTLGQADGCFSLALPVRAGYYEVRAYTREMTNWGTAACFSRVVPVFTGRNPQRGVEDRADLGPEQLSIPEPQPRKGASLGAPRPYVMGSADERLLTFYPEGGLRVGGTAQRVAFKLTDGRGRAVTDTVELVRADGTVVGQSVPEFDGMGTFTLPADFGEGHARLLGAQLPARVRGERYALPAPEPSAAYSLSARFADEGLAVTVAGGAAAHPSGGLLGLAVLNRERACYFDTLTVGREAVELLIPKRALRGGVNRLELFDADGRSRSTRLVWLAPTGTDDRRVRVRLRQNEAAYAPFSPAVVTMELTDAQGKPVQTTVSVAVRDEDGNIVRTHDGGVAASLLLASELRGYIRRPDLYFERDDEAHRRMIDLLLLVQGWTANSFDVMTGADTFDLRQPIEDKLILRGTLFSDNKKLRPQAGFALDMRGYTRSGGAIVGQTRTDQAGRFAFASNVDFEGDYIVQFTARNDEGKRRWSRLALDRWFAPALAPLTAASLEAEPAFGSDSVRAEAESRAPELFQWTDTIPRTLPTVLGEAKISTQGKYRGFTGNRYTWRGGEKRGMEMATKYYNVEQEVEHLKDMGEAVGELGELLARLDRDLEFDHFSSPADAQATRRETGAGGEHHIGMNATDDAAFAQELTTSKLTYRGRELRVYRNNELMGVQAQRQPELYSEIPAEEVKSVALVFDNYATDALSGDRMRQSRTAYSLYVYDIPDYYRYRGKRGVEKRRVQGFTPHTKFYAPNYRSFDLPSAADLRRTLHWEPSLRTDADGRAHLILFTNAREGQRLDISVRGVTAGGGWVEN